MTAPSISTGLWAYVQCLGSSIENAQFSVPFYNQNDGWYWVTVGPNTNFSVYAPDTWTTYTNSGNNVSMTITLTFVPGASTTSSSSGWG
jgi:hypothetical protein